MRVCICRAHLSYVQWLHCVTFHLVFLSPLYLLISELECIFRIIRTVGARSREALYILYTYTFVNARAQLKITREPSGHWIFECHVAKRSFFSRNSLKYSIGKMRLDDGFLPVSRVFPIFDRVVRQNKTAQRRFSLELVTDVQCYCLCALTQRFFFVRSVLHLLHLITRRFI